MLLHRCHFSLCFFCFLCQYSWNSKVWEFVVIRSDWYFSPHSGKFYPFPLVSTHCYQPPDYCSSCHENVTCPPSPGHDCLDWGPAPGPIMVLPYLELALRLWNSRAVSDHATQCTPEKQRKSVWGREREKEWSRQRGGEEGEIKS